MYLTVSDSQRRIAAGGYIRMLTWSLVTLLLGACAALDEKDLPEYDETDYWDSGLVYHRHIDVATLRAEFSSPQLMLSGFVSAVAANANDLYFLDQGAGQLVHVDLATMTGRSLASLRSPSVPGLFADIDGKVYAIDRAHRRLLVVDSVLADIQYLPLGSMLGNPIDVAIVGQGQWLLVLDGLEGNIATLDMFGGVSQVMRPDSPSSKLFVKPLAIAATGYGTLVLDGGTDQVIELDEFGNTTGVYAADDLNRPTALAADACGRIYVADDDGLYLGFADMSLPGRRAPVPELLGSEISDLWSDGVFLFVATRTDGIHMLLVDPTCAR